MTSDSITKRERNREKFDATRETETMESANDNEIVRSRCGNSTLDSNCNKLNGKAPRSEERDEKTGGEDDDLNEDLTDLAKILSRNDLPEEFAEWSFERQRDWVTEKGCKEQLGLPDTVANLMPALKRRVKYGTDFTKKPDWLDTEKFRRGQKFARDHICPLMYAELISLFMIFSFQHGLETLIYTHQSDTPYLAFRRYLSTLYRVYKWYTSDPWTKGTDAYKEILSVRSMHYSIRRQLEESTDEKLKDNCTIRNPCSRISDMIRSDVRSSCPLTYGQKANISAVREISNVKESLNQAGMSITQFGFMGLILLHPKAFGVHRATEEDFEGFCHLWRGLGYLLGIEDEYNFCRGSLADVRKRCQDFVEHFGIPQLATVTKDWEHMSRCLISGAGFWLLIMPFEGPLMFLADILGLSLPTVTKKMRFSSWFIYKLQRFYLGYLTKIPMILAWTNKMVLRSVHRAIGFGPEKLASMEQRSKCMYNPSGN